MIQGCLPLWSFPLQKHWSRTLIKIHVETVKALIFDMDLTVNIWMKATQLKCSGIELKARVKLIKVLSAGWGVNEAGIISHTPQGVWVQVCSESLGHLVFQRSVFCYHPQLPDQSRPPTPCPAHLPFLCLLGYSSIESSAVVLVTIISSLSFLLSMY